MLKRMILAGLLAATAAPVLASDASFDKAAAPAQTATATPAPKTDAATARCGCHKHQA